MPVRSLRMLLVCACLALLAACSTLPSNLVAPTIEVVAVQVHVGRHVRAALQAADAGS